MLVLVLVLVLVIVIELRDVLSRDPFDALLAVFDYLDSATFL